MTYWLDKFLIIFHTLLILFIVFGWIWRKARCIHLIIVILTAFSWLILGIWYGLGYCPLTDWHWHLRQKLGYQTMPASYIKFLADMLTGKNWNATLIDTLTGLIFSFVFVISITLYFINIRQQISR